MAVGDGAVAHVDWVAQAPAPVDKTEEKLLETVRDVEWISLPELALVAGIRSTRFRGFFDGTGNGVGKGGSPLSVPKLGCAGASSGVTGS